VPGVSAQLEEWSIVALEVASGQDSYFPGCATTHSYFNYESSKCPQSKALFKKNNLQPSLTQSRPVHTTWHSELILQECQPRVFPKVV